MSILGRRDDDFSTIVEFSAAILGLRVGAEALQRLVEITLKASSSQNAGRLNQIEH
jgi:hypothetical protein